MRFFLLAGLLFLIAMSAGAAPAGTPIRSHDELVRYLHEASVEDSPLWWLPPGARKRFLGTLVWGAHGLGGFDTSDLRQYLTDPQIRQVLTLFDAQGYAAGIRGHAKPLTEAERKAPETSLERKFDELYFAYKNHAHGGKSSADVPMLYGRLLAAQQTRTNLAGLDDSDMGLLFRAATLASYTTHSPRYLDDLRLDLHELRRRGLATPAQIEDVHDQLIAARRFDEANAFATEYPATAIAPLPPLRQAVDPRNGNPTVLLMEPDGKYMLRQQINMHAPLRIIVVAGCHFSVSAVRAIHADPRLDAFFHEHAVWLANENEPLTDVRDWNRSYPDQPMYVAWRNADWPMLDLWAIPTFYVFRGGKLIDQWSGWDGLDEIRRHLVKNGLTLIPSVKASGNQDVPLDPGLREGPAGNLVDRRMRGAERGNAFAASGGPPAGACHA